MMVDHVTWYQMAYQLEEAWMGSCVEVVCRRSASISVVAGALLTGLLALEVRNRLNEVGLV